MLINMDTLKTILNGLFLKINEKADKKDLEMKINRSEIPNSIELSAEMGLVSPTVAYNGAIYIDNNDAIYIL